MAEYRVVFTRSARKELESLPSALSQRILAAVERLGKDPRPFGVRKIHGADKLWRVRVSDYRVIYTIDDANHMIDVRVIRHRKDAYR